MSITESVAQKLEGFRAGLNADGYDLLVAPKGGGVEIEISAGPTSCRDCLVPKSLMEDMIRTSLADQMIDFTLVYPADRDGD